MFNSIRSLDDIRTTRVPNSNQYNNQNKNSVYVWRDGEIKRIKENLLNPVLSPDGKRVAGNVLGEGMKVINKILVLDLEGNELESISLDQQPGHVRWRPDGKALIFVADASEGLDRRVLFEMDLETKKTTSIVDAPSILRYEYSPDGKKIQYLIGRTSKRSSDEGTYIFDLQTSKSKKLPMSGTSGMWFPDSKHIAYYAYYDEQAKPLRRPLAAVFYKMNIETGESTVLMDSKDLFIGGDPMLSRDGKFFYECKRDSSRGIAIVLRPINAPSKEIWVTRSHRIAKRLFSKDSNPDWWQGE